VTTSLQRQQAVMAYVLARKKADKVLDQTTIPVVEEYERQTGAAMLGLGRLFRGRLREKVDEMVVARAVGAVRSWWSKAKTSVLDAFGVTTEQALTDGFKTTKAVMDRVGRNPLNDATFQHILGLHLNALQLMRDGSSRAFSMSVPERMLREFSATIKEPNISVGDLIARAGAALDGETWKLERLVRTETSYAYNTAQNEAIRQASIAPGFGKVYGRWTERVNDLTGQPMDNRVEKDSMVLHGQIALPDQLFTMPPNAPSVPTNLLGKQWRHPPNRPNDRAVLTPWMRDWGVPAWVFQGGQRIDIRRR